MNLRGSDRLRMVLMGAVAAGGIGPQFGHAAGPVPVTAKLTMKKPGLVAGKPAAAPPRLLPVTEADATIQPVAQSDGVVPTSNKKSEVMRQLELLYQQDGREMPELNTDIKPMPVPSGQNGSQSTTGTPSTNGAATQPAAAPANSAAANGLRTQLHSAGPKKTTVAPVKPSAAPTPTTSAAAPPAKSKNPILAFFKRLVPGNKEPKPTPAPPQYRPDVAPIPPAIVSQPSSPLRLQHSQVAGVYSESGLPLLDTQPRTPIFGSINSNPLPAPLASFVDIPPAPTGDLLEPSAEASLLPPSLVEPIPAGAGELAANPPAFEGPAATDVTGPFTEMSEAEADKVIELNPFTGLKLDDDAGSAAPQKDPIEPPQSAAAAPSDSPATDDPFADELQKMGITPPSAEPAESAGQADSTSQPAAPADAPTFSGIEDQATREKMKKIHERGSMKGLKGFCPVSLRDQRDLVDAKPEFHSTYRGQKFHFADADSKLKFDEEPSRFAPAAYGADVVALTRDKDVVEGSLDFAAWFKGRLYLFGSQEAHDTFVTDPAAYATPVGIE